MTARKVTSIIRTRLQDGIADLGSVAICQHVVVGKDEELPILLYPTAQGACSNIAVSDTHASWCRTVSGRMGLECIDVSGLHYVCWDSINRRRNHILF